jgi:lipopolysaccharide transport system ATP-binding protein
MRFIRKFKEEGTLLFVSHDTAAVLNLCDRAVWLDAGTVRMIGSAKDICAQYQASIEAHKTNTNAFKIGGSRKAPQEPPLPRDQRDQVLSEAGLKPHAEVFQFDPDAPWFGARGATIENVYITDQDENRISTFAGGELVKLHIEAATHQHIARPIVGFYVKDRLGQTLFGDNTYLSFAANSQNASKDSVIKATFEFRVPYMHPGDYSIQVAIAEGTQEDHIQHHWIDDAMFLRITGVHISKGLLGIPMKSIQLSVGSPGKT